MRPPEALICAGPLGSETRKRLDSGEIVAQSRSAQAAVELLAPQSGERVLDLCAAPGIKTAAIAVRVGAAGQVVAIERDPKRASQLEALCARVDASNVRVVVADAADWADGGGYDRVLVDPPCSDLGTLASRPDVRWRKDPATIRRLATIQSSILANGARAAVREGALVYSTCTISRAENEDVAATAAAGADLVADDLAEAEPTMASANDPRFLQARPDRHGSDGFFYARFRKAA
jgi:16S rRNA (cytosine967-C5)-methyltransferase